MKFVKNDKSKGQTEAQTQPMGLQPIQNKIIYNLLLTLVFHNFSKSEKYLHGSMDQTGLQKWKTNCVFIHYIMLGKGEKNKKS